MRLYWHLTFAITNIERQNEKRISLENFWAPKAIIFIFLLLRWPLPFLCLLFYRVNKANEIAVFMGIGEARATNFPPANL